MSKYANLQKDLRLLGHGIRGQNKVSVLAKDLASKLSGEANRLAGESAAVTIVLLKVYLVFHLNDRQ